MGKAWEPETQTEYVRLDFKTAVNTVAESSLYPDQRYLLKRASQGPATQWLYLPALRRVRIVPYQPDDPVLQSQQLFYDLTTIQNLTDYRYQFVDANEQTPVIGAVPLDRGFPVPYEKVVFHLERRSNTYIVTAISTMARGKDKRAELSQFTQIAPDHYRPQHLAVVGEGGRTEFLFHDWTIGTLNPQLITPSQLETQTLAMPVSEARK
jgi:hypothetical protein